MASEVRVAIYGGNGFVGTHLARKLVSAKAKVTCISRSGAMPSQLEHSAWSKQVQWLQGDASQPDLAMLKAIDVLVSVVGAPPLPTFSHTAYQRAVFNNGTTNATAISAAADAGIKRVVLLGAQIPALLHGRWFGYARGKQVALDAAEAFSQLTAEHSAVVIQPGGIYGKRHTKSGRELPIDWLLGPLAKLLPSQLISVDRVAARLAQEVLASSCEQGLTIVKHKEI